MNPQFDQAQKKRLWQIVRPKVTNRICPFCGTEIDNKTFGGAAVIDGELRAFDTSLPCLLQVHELAHMGRITSIDKDPELGWEIHKMNRNWPFYVVRNTRKSAGWEQNMGHGGVRCWIGNKNRIGFLRFKLWTKLGWIVWNPEFDSDSVLNKA